MWVPNSAAANSQKKDGAIGIAQGLEKKSEGISGRCRDQIVLIGESAMKEINGMKKYIL